jgi:hypothetical protein
MFRRWWLANISIGAADRPPLPASTTSVFIHIVESWKANPADPSSNRTLNVYSNAPFVALSVNGVAASPVTPMPLQAWVSLSLPFSPGAVTATALAADGSTVLATASKSSWGAPAALVLTVDAPSASSGTGNSLYLDGIDAALLRATVVDASGTVCGDTAVPPEITFSVVSGPGRIVGTHNGDPALQVWARSDPPESLFCRKKSSPPPPLQGPPHSPTVPSYHGLARAVLQVTQASAVATPAGAGDAASLALLQLVNSQAGAGPESSAVIPISPGTPPPSITVTATAPGLAPSSVTIQTSVQWEDSVLAVAATNVANAYIGL